MGQKVNPIANRLGIIRGWDSNWFGGKDFSEKLVEDAKIRKYLNVRLAKASISKIIIERTLKLVTVTIATARPGIIIGKGGQEVDKLKEELKKLTGKEVQINIFEVKRPEVDAVIVGQNIARQLEGRVSFRRAVKTAIASTMRMGAEGIKVQVSGRVGGAEMARSETMKEGRIPLHTFRRHRLLPDRGAYEGRYPGCQGMDLPGYGLRQARSVRDRRRFGFGTGRGPAFGRSSRSSRRPWRPSWSQRRSRRASWRCSET